IHRHEVRLFDEQPASGAQRSYHTGEGLYPGGKPVEHPAGMHEVELVLGHGVGDDVMPAHRQVGVGEAFEEGCLQVRGKDVPIISHPFAEPRRARAPTAADLPAAPTGADAEGFQMTDGPWVESSLKAD